MRRIAGWLTQAILMLVVFGITLLLTLPLGSLGGIIASLLPDGVRLEQPTGRLLDGRAEALVIEPRPGWPLQLALPRWTLGLDGWQPALSVAFDGGWTLDIRASGLSASWQLTGGDLAILDTSALPIGSGLGMRGQLTGQLAGLIGVSGCQEGAGQLVGQDIQLRAPEVVPLQQVRLSLDCRQGRDDWTLVLGDTDDPLLEARHSITQGHGELKAQLEADHPLFPYWRLADPGLRPGQQRRQW